VSVCLPAYIISRTTEIFIKFVTEGGLHQKLSAKSERITNGSPMNEIFCSQMVVTSDLIFCVL
jgi:hypothetical protein